MGISLEFWLILVIAQPNQAGTTLNYAFNKAYWTKPIFFGLSFLPVGIYR